MPKTIIIDRQAVYQISDAAVACDLTHNAIQSAVRAGELPATKRARRVFIEGEALWRWITGRPQEMEASNA
jgi:hypothetical protein